MSTFLLLTVTGVGLAAMYFLIASGLSLIYGLMGVLNFAHGAFITVGSYATWWMSDNVFDGVGSAWIRFLVSALCGLAAGAIFAALVELVLIRPLYQRHIEQVLVTVGLSLATIALVQGIWGNDARTYAVPGWVEHTTSFGGASVPNDRWLAIGGIAAALAGVLSGVYYTTIDPNQGTSLLIFAFIVVVIGGLGSITGSAIAAVVVGLLQQYANYYGTNWIGDWGLGDLSVLLLLAAVLLVRPRGLAGAVTA